MIVVLVSFCSKDEQKSGDPNLDTVVTQQDLEGKLSSAQREHFVLSEWMRNRVDAARGTDVERKEYAAKSERRRELIGVIQELETKLAVIKGTGPAYVKDPRVQAIDGTKGERIVAEIFSRNPAIHAFYHATDITPRGLSLSLPEAEWNKLTKAQRDEVCRFLAARSSGWEILVGGINGMDILSDRRAVTSKEWRP